VNRFASISLAAISLLVSIAAATRTAVNDETYTEADAGSLGVELVDTTTTYYCAADAGSLGIDDPVAACGH
jgi:hypothetical protein